MWKPCPYYNQFEDAFHDGVLEFPVKTSLLQLQGTMNFLDLPCLVLLSHAERVFLLLPEMEQKLRTQILYNDLPRFLLYTYVPPQFGADEVSDGSLSLLSKMKMRSDALWANLIRL
jgi:hypothetical protein